MAKVKQIECFKSAMFPNSILRFHWESAEGSGQYDLVIEPKDTKEGPLFSITGLSDRMDDGENKEFLKTLLLSIVDHVKVAE